MSAAAREPRGGEYISKKTMKFANEGFTSKERSLSPMLRGWSRNLGPPSGGRSTTTRPRKISFPD